MPESIVIGFIIILALVFGIFLGFHICLIVQEWRHQCMPHPARTCRKHHPGPVPND